STALPKASCPCTTIRISYLRKVSGPISFAMCSTDRGLQKPRNPVPDGMAPRRALSRSRARAEQEGPASLPPPSHFPRLPDPMPVPRPRVLALLRRRLFQRRCGADRLEGGDLVCGIAELAQDLLGMFAEQRRAIHLGG